MLLVSLLLVGCGGEPVVDCPQGQAEGDSHRDVIHAGPDGDAKEYPCGEAAGEARVLIFLVFHDSMSKKQLSRVGDFSHPGVMGITASDALRGQS